MALSKLQYFEDVSLRLSEFTKALSHPARLEILETLAKENTCICGEIVDKLPLAQSTVSQHLKELKKYGLISSEIDGPKSCYTINWSQLDSYFGMVNEFSDKLRKLHQPIPTRVSSF